MAPDNDAFNHLIKRTLADISEYFSESQVVPPTNNAFGDISRINLSRGQGVAGLQRAIKEALGFSVRSCSPRFFDKLYAASDPAGLVAELILGALNSNAHVKQVSPFFTRVELLMIERLGRMFGFASAGGVFCPGGSYSNLHALLAARNDRFPDIAMNGFNSSAIPVVFTSTHSHYSIKKSAIAAGFGLSNVVEVETDPYGRMLAPALEAKIINCLESGKVPFFVNCTAGTTVMGGFDPLEPIADICQRYNCWMHVDASWGGAAIFSTKHGRLLSGCHLSDSITFNPHKMLGVPLLCSVLLTKQPFILDKTLSIRAPYLFHNYNCNDDSFTYNDDNNDKEYNNNNNNNNIDDDMETMFSDLGNRTIGCSRRPDAFKLYLYWIYHGSSGLEERVNLAIENSMQFRELIENYQLPSQFQGVKFKLVRPRERGDFTNVCFWLQPDHWTTNVCRAALGDLTKQLHQRLIHRGRVMVDYMTVPEIDDPLREEPYFFRMVFMNPSVTADDMKLVLDEIAECYREYLRETKR